MLTDKTIAVISTLLIPVFALFIYIEDTYLYHYTDWDIVCYYGIIISFVVSVTAWIVVIIRRARINKLIKGRELKPRKYIGYKVFGIVNVWMFVCTIIAGIRSGGLGGAVLLVYVSPMFLIMIAADILLYVARHTGAVGKAVCCTVSSVIAFVFFLFFSDIVSFCFTVGFAMLAVIIWARIIVNKFREKQ